jgi:predicted glycoside hydrolase/deacetylase ChbG (UPF0249 family)
MRVIINADDLGADETINNEIFALMSAGLVTSSTMITNAPAFEHAVEGAKRFPNCSFGVHLNLTVFPPLTRSDDLEPILDHDGCLSSKLLFQTPITRKLRGPMYRELAAQVQRALDAGLPVSHFDSHENVHTLPKLFPVLKSVQRKFGIRKVRSTINLLPPGKRMAMVRSLKKAVFNLALRHDYATSSPDGLGDFRDFYAAVKTGQVPRFRCLEVMVHPGTTSARYNEEVDLLRSGWQRLLPADVTLASYHSVS